ncbi:MAG: Rubredoxin [uncultured Caballeronia sp.]|nr:MAG: Rubredoxin [uncultured Caballeronia sp.]
MSYKKGIVLEIKFPPERLNDGAGDPYWIDLTLEARRLHDQLARRFASEAQTNQPLDTYGMRGRSRRC